MAENNYNTTPPAPAGAGHTIRRRITVIIGVIAAAGIAASAVSHLTTHRSLTASIVEALLRRTHTAAAYEEQHAALTLMAASTEPAHTIPDSNMFDEEFAGQTYEGLTTYYLNSSNHSNISVLYLHGGGYISECSTYQWKFVNRLADETDAEIIVPDYPLAPWHTYEETYDLLYDWYVPWQYGNESRIIVIMGDSAGGGLALGFTEYLRKMDAPLPNAVILISPWIDLSMTNPEIGDYEDEDPMLDIGTLQAAADAWAGGTALTDYRLSPIYGDLNELPDVTILTGTRELLYPDATLLYDRLLDAGNYAALIVGEGMNHDYPLLPIPEGRAAIHQIADRITSMAE